MGLSRQEYWSGLPFLPPGGLPHPGTEPEVPAAPELVGAFFTYQFFLTAPPEIILYMPSLEKLKILKG